MRDETVEQEEYVPPKQGKNKKGNPRRSSASARKKRMQKRTLVTWLSRKGLTQEDIDQQVWYLQNVKGLREPPLGELDKCPHCGTEESYIVSAKYRDGRSTTMAICCRCPVPVA